MEIYSYNNTNLNFGGTIKSSNLFKNYALEYAKKIRLGDDDWSKLKIFINTANAIKADGSKNEFIMDKIGSPDKQLWVLKYGNYIKQDEFFRANDYNYRSRGYEILERDAFLKFVQFGKEYFGIKEVSKPITEFSPADKYIKRANNFISKLRQARNKDTIIKLHENAQREKNRAEESISEIRERILDNII